MQIFRDSFHIQHPSSYLHNVPVTIEVETQYELSSSYEANSTSSTISSPPVASGMISSHDGTSSTITLISERSDTSIELGSIARTLEAYRHPPIVFLPLEQMAPEFAPTLQGHEIVPDGTLSVVQQDILPQEPESYITFSEVASLSHDLEDENLTPVETNTSDQVQLVGSGVQLPLSPEFIMSPEGARVPKYAPCGCFNMAYIQLQHTAQTN